jgi:hypothetical protein
MLRTPDATHRDQRDSLCRFCRAAYKQRHYAANRQRYIDQARERKQALALARTIYLVAFFREHACVIEAALPYRNWQSILDEIEKCEVVCANCHRRRTARRRGSLRFQLADAGGDRS